MIARLRQGLKIYNPHINRVITSDDVIDVEKASPSERQFYFRLIKVFQDMEVTEDADFI